MDFSTILFHAHSGLRYLVLTAAVVSLGYSFQAMLRGQAWDRPGRILLSAFVGLMDLQILIGIVLTFVYVFYPALWGHLSLMILAAAIGHWAAATNKRRPPGQQSHRTAVLGSAGALILIIGGILAIGRTIV